MPPCTFAPLNSPAAATSPVAPPAACPAPALPLPQVRLAVLDALHASVSCPNPDKCKGAGTEAIADLVGFHDPNSVPVAAFYHSDSSVNYFGKMATDSNPAVR